MRLFESTFKNAAGKSVKTASGDVEFRDQPQFRRIPGFTNKAAGEEIGRNNDRWVAYHKGSGGPVDPVLINWLTSLPLYIREPLGNEDNALPRAIGGVRNVRYAHRARGPLLSAKEAVRVDFARIRRTRFKASAKIKNDAKCSGLSRNAGEIQQAAGGFEPPK